MIQLKVMLIVLHQLCLMAGLPVLDLRKSVFVHPPALYSGDLPSSDLLNAHELEKAHDSSLPMSFDRIDRCDDNEELDAKLLSNSREKVV